MTARPAASSRTLPEWMPPAEDALELTVFRSVPSSIVNLESLRVGDVDGDGRTEVVTGGDGALIWYRAATAEQGVIGRGHFGVSLALHDLDGDGILEVVAGRERADRTGIWQIVAFKATEEPGAEWTEWLLVPEADGEAHDVAFADLDGDGVDELVANAPYVERPGTLAYKRRDDAAAPWERHELVMGISAEGIEVADLDGDGRLEIVHGPDWYTMAPDGPFAGPWRVRSYAPAFRDMGRVSVFDITGDGTPDIVCSEAEYLDGRLSWFENRFADDHESPWLEHPLDWGLFYAHSLSVRRDADDSVRVFAGEMPEGGWRAPRNWQARLYEYSIGHDGTERCLLTRGTGTHEALVADIDDDGELEIVGKDWREPSIQMWRGRSGTSFPSRFRHRMIDRDKPGAAAAIVAADVDGDGAIDLACGTRWYESPTWTAHAIPGVDDVFAAVELDGRAALVAARGGSLVTVSLGGHGWTTEPVAELAAGAARAVASFAGGSAIAVAGADGALHVHTRVDGGWATGEVGGVDTSAGVSAAEIDGVSGLLVGLTWIGPDRRPEPLAHDVDLEVVRAVAGDLDGDGSTEIVVGTLGPDVEIGNDRYRPLGRLYVLSRGGDGRWQKQLVDSLRNPRALALADVDGDGRLEVVCGEHDPSWGYRTQSRLYVYKAADEAGRTWTRHTIDDRFEHDAGPAVFELSPGRVAIASHGTSDTRFVHLWEPVEVG